MSRVIAPNLEQGNVVITDRYVHSTIAYQGYGYEGRKGAPTQRQIQDVNLIATRDVMPNLTILLDMDPEAALTRLAALEPELSVERASRGRAENEPRKFEEENLTFHRRVRDGYLRLARRDPERWLVVDATRDADAVASDIWARVETLLPTPVLEARPAPETGRLI